MGQREDIHWNIAVGAVVAATMSFSTLHLARYCIES